MLVALLYGLGEPQRGALLYAKRGRGSYVYCALVLHRQLRAFHPGAARLLVNLSQRLVR